MRKPCNKIRLFFDVAIERARIAFARMKLLLVLLFVVLCVAVIYQLILHNWAAVQTLFQDATAVGIIGTLLGAVIGGFFSLVGSISVNKYQIRAQTQIRRKNLIYTPLYDELVEIHNIILKSNPYPDYIAFQKQQQTIIAHPQFAVWKSIKSDFRYLETPKKLARAMEKLESNVMAYLEIRDNVGKILTTILNDVLKAELEITCSIVNIGTVIIGWVLTGSNFGLANALLHGYTPHKEIDERTWERVQEIFIETCMKNSDVLCLKERYEAWLQSEEDAILLLSVMIQQVNTTYEG